MSTQIRFYGVAAYEIVTSEMSPREAALAAQWLGLETVLPCHYISPDCDELREFNRLLDAERARGERVPQSVALAPGETYVPDERRD
jgi:L-ascorbate metabolism protein UlaG (beta-lactamase superfamily)